MWSQSLSTSDESAASAASGTATSVAVDRWQAYRGDSSQGVAASAPSAAASAPPSDIGAGDRGGLDSNPLGARCLAHWADGGPSDSAQSLAQRAFAGGGQDFPHRARIQQSFGPAFDLSGAEAHIGGPARRAGSTLGARAFVQGERAAFAEAPDLRLAAHEAAHLLQQRGDVALPGGMDTTAAAGDPYERHADAVAEAVVAGQDASGLLARGPGGPPSAGRGKQPASSAPVQRFSHDDPPWSSREIGSIQRELKRLQLYTGSLDSKFGLGTRAALVEAFGSDEWEQLAAPVVQARLRAAKGPSGPSGQHRLRYGELFKDGLLDITLGIGFDEGGNNKTAINEMTKVLISHGFSVDAGLASTLYKNAGLAMAPGAFGVFYVRKQPLVYQPPAGPARQAHAVVRLVTSADGSHGKQAAGAFTEGMQKSDIAYYSGHGRYGSGPDFDRNMTFTLLDSDGKPEQQIDDYTQLEHVLAAEGKAHKRGAWQQFEWRVGQHRIDVHGDNDGNVFLNPSIRHSEFGAKLMYWNLQRRGGAGKKPLTGKEGALDIGSDKQRDYRVFVFDGCRTQDYRQAIRSTPDHGEGPVDILDTRRTLNWGDEAKTLAVFLESVIKQQSAEEIIKNMDREQSPANPGGKPGDAYQGSGFADNPLDTK